MGRRSHRRAALVAAIIGTAFVASACVPEMPAAPPQSVVTDCTAFPGRICTTGTVALPSAPGAPQGAVTLDDAGALAGTLSAAVTAPSIGCAEFSPFGQSQLGFNFVQTNSVDPSGLTKTAVLSEEIVTELPATAFDVCFQTTHPFPALRPSEFEADFAASDFSNNNVQIAFDGQPDEYSGLLLECSLGFGVPCIVSRSLSPVAQGGVLDQRLQVVVRTEVGDPKLRF